jgi:D-alanyl-D-alanine dipeptidase
MSKSDIYEELFAQVLSYDQVMAKPVAESGERFERVPVDFRPVRPEFRPLVRAQVAAMLSAAERALGEVDPTLALSVVCSYRSLHTQTALFDEQMQMLTDKIPDPLERKRFVHKYAIAAPEAAGHPTGGAVDIQIIRGGMPLAFGTEIWKFEPNTLSLSPFVSREAQDNRKLLRKVMTAAGFAPFDGEWWHFSYGDREWAAYYDRLTAIYGQVELPIE